MRERQIQQLIKRLQQEQIAALLITYPVNRRYLTGFTGSAGFALITKDERLLITDSRYLEQSKHESPEWTVVLHQGVIIEAVAEQCQLLKIGSLGFEAEHLTYQDFMALQELLPNIHLSPTNGWVERLRMRKEPDEIKSIRQAASVVDVAFEKMIEELRPGLTEREVATKIEFLLREQGASSSSFPTIVASGVRSALPHGLASEKALEKGDFVLLDFGAWVNGYTSDITRTVILGKATEKQRAIYEIVLTAQTRTIDSMVPGMKGKLVDKVARDWIASHGYQDYFGHATGHGIGLEVHELPTLRRTSEHVLQEGMVVTVEPGIYLPGFGGVRIEDDVLITSSGSEGLTTATKELIEIDC